MLAFRRADSFGFVYTIATDSTAKFCDVIIPETDGTVLDLQVQVQSTPPNNALFVAGDGNNGKGFIVVRDDLAIIYRRGADGEAAVTPPP